MKTRLLLAIIALPLSVWANMASPVREGTRVATPFISQNVDIVRESILIILDSAFETARFKIEYHLKAHKSGRQIPLLFYAFDFKGDFRAWIDDREITLSALPQSYARLEGTPLSDFKHVFEAQGETLGAEMQESPTRGFLVDIDDLKFFETDLAEGSHIVRVEYVANCWIDRSDWVTERSFRYFLSPAKYWKSFGGLDIALDASQVGKALKTNLGAPSMGDLKSKCSWTFSALPVDVLQISYQPAIGSVAAALIALSPIGLATLFALALAVLHFIAIKRHRKANPRASLSWALIVGSIAVPFLTLLGFIFSFDIIDAAIGEAASRYHGYTFLALALYPILLPAYFVAMWLADKITTSAKSQGTKKQ